MKVVRGTIGASEVMFEVEPDLEVVSGSATNDYGTVETGTGSRAVSDAYAQLRRLLTDVIDDLESTVVSADIPPALRSIDRAGSVADQ